MRISYQLGEAIRNLYQLAEAMLVLRKKVFEQEEKLKNLSESLIVLYIKVLI